MGINNYRPKELTEQRKTISDRKNNTSDLIFADSNNNCKNAADYQKVRDHKSHLEIKKEMDKEDDLAYFDDLMASDDDLIELELLEKDEEL